MARSRRTSSVAAAALAGMASVSVEPVQHENMDSNMVSEKSESLELNLDGLSSSSNNGDLLDRWVSLFKSDQKEAVAIIITIVLQAAGVNEPLPQDYFKRKSIEPSHVIGELVKKLNGKGDPDYPVADRRGAKVVRKSFTTFFKDLGRLVAGDSATLNLDACKSTFMSWILTMSSVAYRPIRVSATLAGLSLFEGIAQGLHDLSKQVDRLNKMKRRKDSEGATVRISAAESLISWWTEGLLIQRYRDVDSGIRMDVLKTLADCITTINPDLFLDNAYLRYIGWSLSDKEERLRAAAVTALKTLYGSTNKTALSAFTDRFKTRILEMAVKDVDGQVREKACELVERMHGGGLLITEDCVEAVRELIADRHDITAASKLATVINHVVFGQQSSNLSCERIIEGVHAYTQGDMHQARVVIKVVSVPQEAFLAFDSPSNLAIYMEIARQKTIRLPSENILKLTASIQSEDDRAAIFEYLLTCNVECSESLLEVVINEMMQCRQETTGVNALKCLLAWRQNEVMRVRVEQWIQTAINTCLEQVMSSLADIDGKRKLDHDDSPYLPLSLLSTVRRCPVNTADIVSVMDKLEGLSMLSQRGRQKKTTTNGPSMASIYHRLLLLLYNDFLWMQSDAKGTTAEERIDRLCALKQSADLARPIMQNGESCSALRKASIAILTDCALISKTKDDVEAIIGALLSVNETSADIGANDDEWKAVIAGRLFMAGLIEDTIAIPLLIAFRKSKVGGEICRAAVERSKSLPVGQLIVIISTLLPDMDGLKYAISHYKPVIKGTGHAAVLEGAKILHDAVLGNLDNDAAGALLGFVFEELGDNIVDALSTPPASFKQYRRLFERLCRSRPHRATVQKTSSSSMDTVTSTADLVTDDDGDDLNTDGAFDLTSPGMDLDAPSLPNSPLDKIIRLE